MGLSVKEVSEDGKGLRITRVQRVSPGCVMGLQPGDVIQALNGTRVANSDAFEATADQNVKTSYRPWCFSVLRQGKTMKLPADCKFREMRKDPKKRRYVCDPLNMRTCGPLTKRCSERGS